MKTISAVKVDQDRILWSIPDENSSTFTPHVDYGIFSTFRFPLENYGMFIYIKEPKLYVVDIHTGAHLKSYMMTRRERRSESIIRDHNGTYIIQNLI